MLLFAKGLLLNGGKNQLNKLKIMSTLTVCSEKLKCFFGIEGHVALDRNPGPRYNTLLLQLIPGDLLNP